MVSRWWQLKYFWHVHPGFLAKKNDSQFDYCNIFQRGWFNHQKDWISSPFPPFCADPLPPLRPADPTFATQRMVGGGFWGKAWVGGAGWAKIQGFKKERQNTWKGGRKFQGAGLTHGFRRVFQKRWQFQNWKKHVCFFIFSMHLAILNWPVKKSSWTLVSGWHVSLFLLVSFPETNGTREKHLHPLPRRDWLGKLSAVLPGKKNTTELLPNKIGWQNVREIYGRILQEWPWNYLRFWFCM